LRRVAVVAAAAFILAGCAQGSQTAGAGDPNTVTYIGDEATILPGVEAASEYIEEVTGMAFSPRNIQSTENYQQVIRSSLATDSTTDLIKWWSGYRLQELAQAGGLADISDVWEQAAAQGWVNPDTRGSYSYDGKVYGLPIQKAYWVMYYNKHVFEANGLSVPTTWEEFDHAAQVIKDSGATPFFATIEPGWTSFLWFEEILTKLDPEFYIALTEGEASYTDPTAVRAMEIWADFYERGFFTPADTPWDNEAALFKAGEVAMSPMGTWRNGTFADAGMTPDDYGIFLLPTVEPGTTQTVIQESGIFAVAEKAQNLEGAKAWMGQWLSPDAQTAYQDSMRGISPNPTLTLDEPVLQEVVGNINSQGIQQLERYWEASPPALIEGNVQDLAAFMANPAKSNIMPTLEAMQARADVEWAKWNQ